MFESSIIEKETIAVKKGLSKYKDELSTIFIAMGIISFAMTAMINYYTIKRINSGK